jgi:hypothetical protein
MKTLLGKLIVGGMLLFLFLINIQTVQAAVTYSAGLGGLASTANNAGYGPDNLVDIIGKIVKAVLLSVGILFLIMMIFGGYLWMTSNGNEKTTGKAKSLIFGAIAGLIIVVAAYVLTTFLSGLLL